MYTHFWDMSSGGSTKLDWNHIFIEAPEEEAKIIFYNRFGNNPERVSCTCCGDDYSISESPDLEDATGFERGCKYAYLKDGKEIPQSEGWIMGTGNAPGVTSRYIEEKDPRGFREYVTLEEYKKNPDVLIIPKEDIKPEERIGNVPEQGYVWKD